MNSALIKLGAAVINTPNDNNHRARLCKAQYPRTRDKLLRSHPWKFNKAYAELALVSPQPDNIFDYDYVYQLPVDCARVFETNLCADSAWEEIEGGLIACNDSTLKIKYGKFITDTSKFDSVFAEALADELAADIAYAITQSTSQADKMRREADLSLARARSFSAQTSSPKVVGASSWLSARR